MTAPIDVTALARRIVAGDQLQAGWDEVNVLAQAVVLLGETGPFLVQPVAALLNAEQALSAHRTAVQGQRPSLADRAKLAELSEGFRTALVELRTTFEKELNHG